MSHQGVERTKRRARQTVYWPGINNDIATTILSCNSCQEGRPSQRKEPMATEPPPSMIFEDVSCDFFSYGGHEYLVYVDRYSGWPVLFHFQHGNTKTRHLIHCLRKCFSDLGVPKRLRSDGGPQFASRELRIFLEKFGVNHVRSTPHFPQSNGHAEAAVKAMKALVSKTTTAGRLDTDEFHLRLLEWRNTPREAGLSPAQIVFGHSLRSLVPAHRRSFHRKWHKTLEDFNRTVFEKKKISEDRYNLTSKPLLHLHMGEEVRIQNPKSKIWDECGTVVGVGKNRDYLIKLPNGKIMWRNRKFLKEDKYVGEGMDTTGEDSTPPRRSPRHEKK